MGTRVLPELDAAHRLDAVPEWVPALEPAPAGHLAPSPASDPALEGGQASSLLWLTRRVPGGAASAQLADGDPSQHASLPAVCLNHELRSRSRLKAQLSDGRAVGIVLARGSIMRGGDLLLGPSLRVRVVAAEEDVIDASAEDPALLVRAAYHLGNRHVPVQVAQAGLRLGWDSVLADMLSGLGLSLRRVRAPFEPEAGAYAQH